MKKDRIQQFKQMAEADPDNELGHFSLGKAYLEAGQFAEAAASLSRALEINPLMSKAFQHLGEAHDKAGHHAQAVEAVTRGVTVADKQGDRKVRDGLAEMLRSWNAPVPAFESTAKVPVPGASGQAAADFRCLRCGSPRNQLPKAPFKGAKGERIHAHVCAACWQEWIRMGTKVINELGLVLATQEGQRVYDQYMVEFLQLEEN